MRRQDQKIKNNDKNLKQNIDKYTDYEVSFEYDDDGFINEVIIENV